MDDFNFPDSDFDESDFEQGDYGMGGSGMGGSGGSGLLDAVNDGAWNTDGGIDDSYFDGGGTAESNSDDEDAQVAAYDNESRNALSKTAKMGIVVAIGIVVIISIGARVVYGLKNAKKDTPRIDNSVTYDRVYEEDNYSSYSGGNTGSTGSTGGSSIDSWSKVTYSSIGKVDTPMEGEFSVTSVDSYARILASGEVQVKTEAKGSISGLAGTYVVEVPFSVSGAVKLGTKLKVRYNIADVDGNRVVGDIKLQ